MLHQAHTKSGFAAKNGFSPDDYETPQYVFDMLVEELDPSEWTVWEPFPGSGHSTRYLRSKGFQVTNGNHTNFFDHKRMPKPLQSGHKVVVITNPPYSKKKQILEKLRELQVEHIALFVPVGTMARNFFKLSFPQENNQFIFHQLACRFLHPLTHQSFGNSSFYLMWLTCGLNMKRNVMYKKRRVK